MAEIVTQAVDERLYEAEVTVDGGHYAYRVSVPDDLVERVGADPPAIVRATIAFLLDREPPTSIMERFDCSVVSRYFPDYEAELPRYLEGPGTPRVREAWMPGSKGRPKSLILDLYGAYIRQLGGWIAVSNLIRLMGQLGVDEQAVRSAVSRMTRRGLLAQQTLAGVRGYRLSDEALRMVAEGDRRIFSTIQPARLDDGWIVVAFSVPEDERDRRHVLRSRLTWMGFGMLANGVWMAPRRMLPELRDTVRRLEFERYVHVFDGAYGGFEELERLVRRCWDLDGLRAMYRQFLSEFGPVRRRWTAGSPDLDELRAFVDYTSVLDRWRRFPYLDPGLPVELLPSGWEGRAAADLFFELRERLELPAARHVERVTTPDPRARGMAADLETAGLR